MTHVDPLTAIRYAEELDRAAAVLTRLHPVGQVKAIGRLEVTAALLEVEQTANDLRDVLARVYGFLAREHIDRGYKNARNATRGAVLQALKKIQYLADPPVGFRKGELP